MSDKKNKKAGRPKKTADILPENWGETVLELYEQGASDVEVKAYFHKTLGSFSNDLWDRWLKEEPMFSETIKTGRVLSQAWWEFQAKSNLLSGGKDAPTFSATLWYMNMKNRFGWADKQEVKTETRSEVTLATVASEKVDERIKELLST